MKLRVDTLDPVGVPVGAFAAHARALSRVQQAALELEQAQARLGNELAGARRLGVPLEELGRTLGVTKQAVSNRLARQRRRELERAAIAVATAAERELFR